MLSEQIFRGKSVDFRLASVNDAKFISDLRNSNRAEFLNSSGDEKVQKKWLENYKIREMDGLEFYFVFLSKISKPCGLARIYDIKKQEKIFTWGSWLFSLDAPKFSAFESAARIYEFTFFYLNLEKAVFDVKENNSNVLRFHRKYANEIDLKNGNVYFDFDRADFLKTNLFNYISENLIWAGDFERERERERE